MEGSVKRLELLANFWQIALSRDIPRNVKSENSGPPGRTFIEWWAWVDLNHRPRPYQGSVVRFYNNLQDRGDCQTTRKSYKTSVLWVGLWVGKSPRPQSITLISVERSILSVRASSMSRSKVPPLSISSSPLPSPPSAHTYRRCVHFQSRLLGASFSFSSLRG
jgi:hypothetical protein